MKFKKRRRKIPAGFSYDSWVNRMGISAIDVICYNKKSRFVTFLVLCN